MMLLMLLVGVYLYTLPVVVWMVAHEWQPGDLKRQNYRLLVVTMLAPYVVTKAILDYLHT